MRNCNAGRHQSGAVVDAPLVGSPTGHPLFTEPPPKFEILAAESAVEYRHRDGGAGMWQWLLLLCSFVVMLLAGAVTTSADQIGIVGTWQQVETTAGACPECGLTIKQEGGVLNVIASNGWSAMVDPGGSANPIEAAGTGVWSMERRGWVSGRSFDIVLRLLDQRLHMDMRVRMPDGSSRLVEAVFERIWLGA
jgi:hypothetical protein